MAKKIKTETVQLSQIVGGGQAIGNLESGKKIFVWSGLPGETVEVIITKSKSNLAEGVVRKVIKASGNRISPFDKESYLSTSPWQIMKFEYEQSLKKKLILDAFEMHKINLTSNFDVYTDDKIYNYRNKMEYAFWWDKEKASLDLAFFKRSSHAKIPIQQSSLAMEDITKASKRLLEILRKRRASGSDLKTAIIRASQNHEVAIQLYVKNKKFEIFSDDELSKLDVKQFELIYSEPKSPASVITNKLQSFGKGLHDEILGKDFHYSTEGFFQVNLAVYQKALNDMKNWVLSDKDTIDLYSGVGTIGLNIGAKNTKLIEINESAFSEMQTNIKNLKIKKAKAILSSSENALDEIQSDSCVIVDPPRAGLHQKLVARLLEAKPKRIIYLSCNPTTQARDIEQLLQKYKIIFNRGYNFFPRTPHIEHLVVLDNTIA